MPLHPSIRSPRACAALWLLSSLVALAHAQTVAPVVVPRLTHPGAGQTIYILMPDRFANGDPSNDRGGIAGGPEQHGYDPTRTGYFHGGDFPGVLQKLDYIAGLNVSTIWTTPPFKNNPVQSGSAGYHGYWITDFLNIDPHFGTNADYRELLRQAHARGLRVYLDIVVNHTGDIIKYPGEQYSYIDAATAPTRDASGKPFDERAVAYNGLPTTSPRGRQDGGDPAEALAKAGFPALDARTSFARPPIVPPGLEHAKNPAWLNDPTLYHNRGNSTFAGESATRGDFVGLDDVMTEHPRAVRGFIDIFGQWLEWGVDGFRIDTMRHVNAAFWQAFNPAMRAKARALGRPDFLQFGEVMNEVGDVAYLSEFSTGTMPADSTTDFGFAAAARKFVSQGGPAAALEDFFLRDDYYADHDSNVHASVTLLGNYDIGRWGYFLLQDNPGASLDQLADLARLGHGLMYFARGMPVLHYGDEQGMLGAGGNDQQARETMFPTQTSAYRNARLLATTRTGADDKFDVTHPFYRLFAQLGQLRREHTALRTGAMILRPTAEPALFAFSRIDRNERTEYLAVFNNSRTATLTVSVPTSQRAGAKLVALFNSNASRSPATSAHGLPDSQEKPTNSASTHPRPEVTGHPSSALTADAQTANVRNTNIPPPTVERAQTTNVRNTNIQSPNSPGAAEANVRNTNIARELTTDAHGAARVTLAPLQFALWRAERPLAAPATAPMIALVAPATGAHLTFGSREIDDLVFPARREIRAEVSGGDGIAEVTFAMVRASRPNQIELLGTDDAPPYRVFWTPPADLAPDEKLEFTATVNDLRGHTAAAKVSGITVAPTSEKVQFGIARAQCPTFTVQPPAEISVAFGTELKLTAAAEGSGDLEYQWYRDGELLRGATSATLVIPQALTAHSGRYRVAVHNLAGTTLSSETLVTVGTARLVRHAAMPSQFAGPRHVDVWLPPGYNANTAERYPVLYMHDGQNLFDPNLSYGGITWGIDEALHRLIATGKTRGAIVVGIWNNGYDRLADYMPRKAVITPELQLFPGGPRLSAAAIKSDAYLKFLVEELKPFVDRTYRTLPDRAHTSVMGSSMGGLISAYALAEYPDVFGAAGCVSTHWPIGEGCTIDYFTQKLPRAGAHRLYFDFGTATLDALYEPYQQRMDAALRTLGYTEGRDWLTKKFPGAEHNEKAWSARVDLPLEFLLADK